MHHVKERGVALVLVLGLLSMVSVWAITAAYEDWISLRQAENMELSSRAWMAAESGLELGRRLLQEDSKNSQTDDLTEDWAQSAPAFPVDEGEIYVLVEDANRFLNLNDLVNSQGVAQPARVAIIKRLFSILELPPNLVNALVDWMDADDSPSGPGGAESSAYSMKSYGPKNMPLDRLEEITLIAGFNSDIVDELRGLVIAGESKGRTLVNINTAPREVLLSLSQQMTPPAVDTILMLRKAQPFTSVGQLTSQPQVAAIAGQLTAAGITVKSDVFIVRSRAKFGRVRWGEEMLLARKPNKLEVIYRQRLGWKQ